MTTASENNPDQEPTETSDPSELEAPSQHSSPDSSSGEPCIYCPTGHFESGTTTITLERSGTTLVVKQVPGKVCWACGEALLSEKTVDRLQDMIERAVEAGIDTAVRSYTTENESPPAEMDTSDVQKEGLPQT